MAITRFDIEHGLIWNGNLLNVSEGDYPFDLQQTFKNSRNEYIRAIDYIYYPDAKKIVQYVEFIYLRGQGKLKVDIKTVVQSIKTGKLIFSGIGNYHL